MASSPGHDIKAIVDCLMDVSSPAVEKEQANSALSAALMNDVKSSVAEVMMQKVARCALENMLDNSRRDANIAEDAGISLLQRLVSATQFQNHRGGAEIVLDTIVDFLDEHHCQEGASNNAASLFSCDLISTTKFAVNLSPSQNVCEALHRMVELHPGDPLVVKAAFDCYLKCRLADEYLLSPSHLWKFGIDLFVKVSQDCILKDKKVAVAAMNAIAAPLLEDDEKLELDEQVLFGDFTNDDCGRRKERYFNERRVPEVVLNAMRTWPDDPQVLKACLGLLDFFEWDIVDDNDGASYAEALVNVLKNHPLNVDLMELSAQMWCKMTSCFNGFPAPNNFTIQDDDEANLMLQCLRNYGPNADFKFAAMVYFAFVENPRCEHPPRVAGDDKSKLFLSFSIANILLDVLQRHPRDTRRQEAILRFFSVCEFSDEEYIFNFEIDDYIDCCIERFIPAMRNHPRSLYIQLYALAAIQKLISLNQDLDGHGVFFGENNGHTLVLLAMRNFPQNSRVQQLGCVILEDLYEDLNFWTMNHEYQTLVLDPLRNHPFDTDVQIAALTLWDSIIRFRRRDEAYEGEVVELVLDAVRNHESMSVHYIVMSFLTRLLRQDGRVFQAIWDSKCLPILLRSVSNNNWLNREVPFFERYSIEDELIGFILGLLQENRQATISAVASVDDGVSVVFETLLHGHAHPISTFPALARVSTKDGRLPLHCVASLCSDSKSSDRQIEMAEYLITEYSDAVRIRDGKGRLPLHGAIEAHAPLQLISLLLDANRGASMVRDGRGLLPIHLVIQTKSSWEVFHAVFQAEPNIEQKCEDASGKPEVPFAFEAALNDCNLSQIFFLVRKNPSVLKHYGSEKARRMDQDMKSLCAEKAPLHRNKRTRTSG